MAMSPRKMKASGVKKMRGGGMAMKPKKMRGGGMAKKNERRRHG